MRRADTDVGAIDPPGLLAPLLGCGLPVPLHLQDEVQVLLGVLPLEEGPEERRAVGGLEEVVHGGGPGPGLHGAGQGARAPRPQA